jgi:hypothetical protein
MKEAIRIFCVYVSLAMFFIALGAGICYIDLYDMTH